MRNVSVVEVHGANIALKKGISIPATATGARIVTIENICLQISL